MPGSTLLLTELQHHWRPITQLSRALESELLELGVRMTKRIGANAYLTPARSQGFDIHYDDHCVFIVQLAAASSGRSLHLAWSSHSIAARRRSRRTDSTRRPSTQR